MIEKQIERNQRIYDLIGTLICAFFVGLIFSMLMTPGSFFNPTRPLSFTEKTVALFFFCLPFFEYLASYYAVWKIYSWVKFGREVNWIWIILLANISLWLLITSLQSHKTSIFDSKSLIFLILFNFVSIPPMFLIWVIGFCHRTVKRNSKDKFTLLNINQINLSQNSNA